MYTAHPHEETLERICSETIAADAAHVDKDSRFPGRGVDALAQAGLLGACSAAEAGGLGLGMPGAARIVRRVAEECGSTAMVATMHYCAAAVLESLASMEVRRGVASGRQLATLAFSETGTRSHFWAPLGSAERLGGDVILNASKSWVTSAHKAVLYVWSSRPVEANAASTIWLVPASTGGLATAGNFEGLGLRGNDSCAVTATGAVVPAAAMLGSDGQGFEIMMNIVMPVFAVLNAACSVGLMEGALRRTIAHASGTRHADSGSALCDLPTVRGYISRMRIRTDMTDALLSDTLAALGAGRADATLRVLEVKAAAGESANEVLDLAMRVCGGAAFRKEVGVERIFRDARAAGVMAPTTDVLYDFIGKAVCGLPLF